MASAVLSNKIPCSTVLLSWTSPPLGWAKLNAYGCMKRSEGNIGSRGFHRDSTGNWLAVFAANLGKGGTLSAELGFFFGLKLVWKNGYRAV